MGTEDARSHSCRQFRHEVYRRSTSCGRSAAGRCFFVQHDGATGLHRRSQVSLSLFCIGCITLFRWLPTARHVEAVYGVTGRYYGNLFRFINHSCDPNCFIQPVLSHHLDRSRPDINIFAMRTVFPGEEISYDYGQYQTTSLDTDFSISTLSGTTWKNGWAMIADVELPVVRSVTLRWNHEEHLAMHDVTSELLSIHCSFSQASRTVFISVYHTHLHRANQRPNIRTLSRRPITGQAPSCSPRVS